MLGDISPWLFESSYFQKSFVLQIFSAVSVKYKPLNI